MRGKDYSTGDHTSAHDFKMGDTLNGARKQDASGERSPKKHSSPIIFKGYTVHASREEPPRQMFGSRSKYSSSSFLPPSPLPSIFSDSMNSIRSIHLTIL